MRFTIGADPELFLQDASGKFISAIGKVGGSKWAPRLISREGHAVQEDNVSCEFNIPPSNSSEEFINNINFVLGHLTDRFREMGLSLSRAASTSFPEDQLQDPEALVFGCEPDFNAWTRSVNPRPHADDPNLRSCGGHIHIGTDLDPFEVVKAMDLFVGLPSSLMDTDVKRRLLYGKMGACRIKNYGPEYRAVSNYWIFQDDLKAWVYQQTGRALQFVQDGHRIDDLQQPLEEAINNGNRQEAERLVSFYRHAGVVVGPQVSA